MTRLANGKEFFIARHVSVQNKYIQVAQLNGKPIDKQWLPHFAAFKGAMLEMEMADHTNLEWGSALEDAPL